jgi:hypothetical protein
MKAKRPSLANCIDRVADAPRSLASGARVDDLTRVPHHEARCCTPLEIVMPTTKQRLSINLTDSEYAELSDLAVRNNLSMAWIGHKAILDFLENIRSSSAQLPLALNRRPGPDPRGLPKMGAQAE